MDKPTITARGSIRSAFGILRQHPLAFWLLGIVMQLPGIAWDRAFPLNMDALQSGDVTQVLAGTTKIPMLCLGSVAGLWLTWTFASVAARAVADDAWDVGALFAQTLSQLLPVATALLLSLVALLGLTVVAFLPGLIVMEFLGGPGAMSGAADHLGAWSFVLFDGMVATLTAGLAATAVFVLPAAVVDGGPPRVAIRRASLVAGRHLMLVGTALLLAQMLGAGVDLVGGMLGLFVGDRTEELLTLAMGGFISPLVPLTGSCLYAELKASSVS